MYFPNLTWITWCWRVHGILVSQGAGRGVVGVSVAVHEGVLHMTGQHTCRGEETININLENQFLTRLLITSLMWADLSADIKVGVIQTKTEAPGPHVIFPHNCQFSDLIGNPNLSKLAPVKNCCDSPLVKTTLKPSTKSEIPSCQFRVNYGLIVSTDCAVERSHPFLRNSNPLLC